MRDDLVDIRITAGPKFRGKFKFRGRIHLKHAGKIVEYFANIPEDEREVYTPVKRARRKDGTFEKKA